MFVLVLLFIVLLISSSVADPISVSVKVINYAGEPIELFWINTFQRDVEYVKQTKKPIRNSTEAVINSYDTHQFEIRFLRNDPDASTTFTKGPEDETVIVRYNEETGKLELEQVTDLNKMFKQVEEEISSKCYHNHKLGSQQLSDCISSIVLDEVHRLERTKGLMKRYHDSMSSKLREYSCQADKMDYSTAQRSFYYRFLGEIYNVSVFLDTPHAKLYTIDNFATTQDCRALKEESLQINGKREKGIEEFSARFPDTKDPLRELYATALYFLNYEAEYHLLPTGQDNVHTSLLSVGAEIKPHCDGFCTGADFNPGDAVATVLFDCTSPQEGGDFLMPAANIFLPAKIGQAIVITYKGNDNKMDDGYTKYSTCPVRRGEKRLVKAVLREGDKEPRAIPSTRGLSSPPPIPTAKGSIVFDEDDEF